VTNITDLFNVEAPAALTLERAALAACWAVGGSLDEIRSDLQNKNTVLDRYIVILILAEWDKLSLTHRAIAELIHKHPTTVTNALRHARGLLRRDEKFRGWHDRAWARLRHEFDASWFAGKRKTRHHRIWTAEDDAALLRGKRDGLTERDIGEKPDR